MLSRRCARVAATAASRLPCPATTEPNRTALARARARDDDARRGGRRGRKAGWEAARTRHDHARDRCRPPDERLSDAIPPTPPWAGWPRPGRGAGRYTLRFHPEPFELILRLERLSDELPRLLLSGGVGLAPAQLNASATVRAMLRVRVAGSTGARRRREGLAYDAIPPRTRARVLEYFAQDYACLGYEPRIPTGAAAGLESGAQARPRASETPRQLAERA